jgi:hypothetical protein
MSKHSLVVLAMIAAVSPIAAVAGSGVARADVQGVNSAIAGTPPPKMLPAGR